MSNFGGVYAFPATAMREDEEIDLVRYQEHIEWLLDAGVHGLVACGSTGEFAYLTFQERQQIALATVERARGRAPVLVMASALSTRDVLAHVRYAAAIGADGVLVNPQSYFRLNARQIVGLYQAVSSAAGMPVFLYNAPATTGVDMAPELIARLALIPGVAGIKEGSGDVGRVSQIRRLSPDPFAIFCGHEALALPTLMLGGAGWFSALANLVPQLCVALYEHAARGEWEKALVLHRRLEPLGCFLQERQLAAAVKTGLVLRGMSMGAPRQPLTLLSELETDQLRLLLRKLDDDLTPVYSRIPLKEAVTESN
jgi:4-hydroxy-tetrahydrodipicolinate synthase